LARRRFFVSLLLLAILLLAVLVRPLATALLLAAVLAGILWPLQRKLTRWLRGRRQLAASVLVFATLMALVGPVAALSAFVIDEASQGATFVADTLRSKGFEGLLRELPDSAEKVVKDALATVKKHADGDVRKSVESKVNDQAAKVAAAVGGALAATWEFIFNTVMMLIALYFLLTQGSECVAWLDHALPLRPGQTHELLHEFKRTSYAVVVSTLITAAVQAIAALIGYLIARVPHPIFFAAITFFGAFIPAIGAASFTLLAAAILLITGHPYLALFLAIWAVTVVGLVDNVVKPLVLRGGMDMPGAVVFFALIGGLSAFGPIGLLLGPLTVAFFVVLLRMYQRDFVHAGETVDEPSS
jgi:predicted PurR-regulated permease PerM